MMDEYDRSKVNAKINEEGVTDNLMYSMYKYAPSELFVLKSDITSIMKH